MNVIWTFLMSHKNQNLYIHMYSFILIKNTKRLWKVWSKFLESVLFYIYIYKNYFYLNNFFQKYLLMIMKNFLNIIFYFSFFAPFFYFYFFVEINIFYFANIIHFFLTSLNNRRKTITNTIEYKFVELTFYFWLLSTDNVASYYEIIQV